MGNDLALRALTEFIHFVLQGSIPEDAVPYFSSSRLIAPAKGDSPSAGNRSVAMGDAYHRLASRYLAHTSRLRMAESLFPLQLGEGTASGCEIVVRVVQAIMAAHPDWGVLIDDIANAFNSFP